MYALEIMYTHIPWTEDAEAHYNTFKKTYKTSTRTPPQKKKTKKEAPDYLPYDYSSSSAILERSSAKNPPSSLRGTVNSLAKYSSFSTNSSLSFWSNSGV